MSRRSLREIAAAIGEKSGVEVPTTIVGAPRQRVRKERRDYTSRELYAMAADAANGIPPAGSPAQHEIRRATEDGDFERANALTREVKEKAPALARLARAAEKSERRAKRGHIHICKDWPHECNPANGGMGPCRCACGAVAIVSLSCVVWRRRDGTEDPFPDPREAEHPKARRMNGERSG